jgi:ribokinase
MRAAVVGHVEWIEFLRVERLPTAGEIVHASERWEEAAGGGAAAAVQLLKLAGEADFFTALGDDEVGERSYEQLTGTGLRMHAATRPRPTRRGVTQIDGTGERTITVLGERISPIASDELPWERLEDVDAVYFSAGDVGALAAARRARVLVVTTRVFPTLLEAGIEIDALIGSSQDASEVVEVSELDVPPKLVVWTKGAAGGTFIPRGDEPQTYDAVPAPGPIVDRYGAGDAFAAGLAFGLATTDSVAEALELAARCGAAALTGRGPYEGQLRATDLG